MGRGGRHGVLCSDEMIADNMVGKAAFGLFRLYGWKRFAASFSLKMA